MWFDADSAPQFGDHNLRLSFSAFEPELPFAREDWRLSESGPGFEFNHGRPFSRADWQIGAEVEPAADGLSASTINAGWSEVVTDKDGRVMDEGDIVVVGRRTIRLDAVNWWDAGAVPNLFWTVHADGGGGIGTGFDWAPDEGNIDTQINFDRPLTESEAEALEDFLDAIEALTAAINSLADNAEVRLPNGAYVTGAALKSLWARTDFVINDNITYRSGSILGQADMVDGQPMISFNIQALDQFNDIHGGMNWLVAHDFGHLTQWGMPYFYDQVTANDIAREILSSAGLPYFLNPGFGYSPGLPIGFSVPDGEDGGAGGGFGGGGGGGDYIP